MCSRVVSGSRAGCSASPCRRDGAADVLEGGERLARGVQRFARPPGEALRSPDRCYLVHLVGFGDCREAHHLPRLLLEHVADQVVLVQPLHDDDDGSPAFVVEPAVEGVGVPIIGGIPSRLGERLLRLQRVIDQNQVGAAPGQHAAGGGGEAIALAGGDEFLHRLAVRRQAGREDLPIPRAGHDAAAVAGELVGKILGIADAQDLGRRVVPQTPGREGDRGQQ